MIYYCHKEINPLKVEISKIIFEESNKEEKEKYNCLSIKQYQSENIKEKEKLKPKKSLKKKGNNPPKKQIPKKVFPNNKDFKRKESEQLEVFGKSSRLELKKRKTKIPEMNAKSTKSHTNKHDIFDKQLQLEDMYDNKNTVMRLKEGKNNQDEDSKDKKLDNFELNNLDYDEACELDKRGFCRTYWSFLMREHVFLLTFFAHYDYNLFYIKIERFLTSICIEMTMNGLFFVHESMHRKYVEGQEFTFVQKIPQLLFTLISANIIEVILCFLGMTDVHMYQIKNLPKFEKRGEKVYDIIDKIKRKLVAFFVITFLLFLFNWYFISAFCAVYQNTQKIFIRDSAISFLTSMIEPFILYGVNNVLRYISLLLCCKRKLCCLYKLSDFIPIF